VGSFTAGYTAAKHRRQHGILVGLGCGIVMYFVVFFFGLLLMRSFSGAGTLMKLILILLCSCIGGVCGVNRRIEKPPR
jgi:putative membrane protein (TIGR04086 family)